VPIHARLREHLEREHGAEVTLVSGNLARREELRAELDSPAARTAEVYLVEIKAAAIDVVVEAAADREIPVVFSDNEVLTLPGEEPLDERLAALADAAVGEKVPA
jgi:cyclic 2,3-diphosphoglycerate synthetase